MRLLDLPPRVAVWRVAWPMAAMGVLRSFYVLTDSFWVGRMGPAPLAALGGSAFAWWMIHLTCELPATGAHALVARHEGAEQPERIGPTATAALLVGLGLAAVLAVGVFPMRGVYFDLLGFEAGSAERGHGLAYVGAALLGAVTLAAFAIVGGVLRGLGDTRTALGLTAATLVINAALDPLLIWGVGDFGGLGVAGAAWATAASNAVGAVLGAFVLHRRGLRVGRPSFGGAWDVTRIGAPVALSGVGFALVYVVLGRLITSFGTAQIAALGVGHRLESVPFFVCVACGVGAATMVGQHLGAKDREKAEASVRAAVRLALIVMVPCTALLVLLARPLFALFTDDPATLDAGVLYLRVQAAVLVTMAFEEVYKGAFTGAGRTLVASLISFGLTAARIPLAYLLAGPFGVLGVWLAIAASTAVKGALLTLAWRVTRED